MTDASTSGLTPGDPVGAPAGKPPSPDYGPRSLGAVLPGVAAALGVELGLPAVDLPPADRICVVLIDGLGAQLLAASVADAPFLASLQGAGTVLRVGCPSTTATSLGSFGTGLPPGMHGLVGYSVMDPARGVLLNELRWDPLVDPIAWQPHPTVFEQLAAAGVSVLSIGNPEFEGSGLTTAVFRGARFAGANRLHRRVELVAQALAVPGLVHLYWGDVDAAGHRFGWQSSAWRRRLRVLDDGLHRLAQSLPARTLLVVTADHGMLDVPRSDRLDLAARPDLQDGIAILGGEGRFAQAYCVAGAADDVAARLAAAVGTKAWVRTREQAFEAGWFGPVEPRVVERVGDVLVAAAESFVFVDSRTAAPSELTLIGQHGSLTDAEQLVPLLTLVC